MRAGIGISRVTLGAAIALTPATAFADRFDATRSDKMVEHAHDIEVIVDRGFATLRVQRTVFNGGRRHDQATFWIDLPSGSVATGLRTLGTWRGKPHWFDGELMEAEAAAAKYAELTGLGGYYPKDPALLSWRSPQALALQVFPCPPDALKSVEYTLTLPSEYDEGRYAFTLPRLGTEAFIANMTLEPARRDDVLRLGGRRIRPGERVPAAGELGVELVPSDPPLLDAHLAVISTGEQYAIRYEMALAPAISQIPKGVAAVVVIDTSASLSGTQVQAQLAAARAYLGHLVDPKLRARAAVITFDREAHVLKGGLQPASAMLAALDGFDPKQRNGSHADVALQRAAKLLSGTRHHLRRVVLMSDTLMRAGLAASEIAELSKSTGAVTHVAIVRDTGNASVSRSVSHPWRHSARQSGGLAWKAEISTDIDDRDAMHDAYLEWARPVRVHDPEVFAPGLAEAIDVPDAMDEGFGTAVLSLQATPVRHVIVSGELWSRPLHQVVAPNEAFADRWAALFFGSELESALSEPEAMVLAMRGGAVSPVTSYLAIEPGVRPSTEGLEEGEGFGSGGGSLGFGRASRVPRVRMGRGTGKPFDPGAFLASKVRRAATTCGVPEAVGIEVELQSTRTEIAQIDRVAFVAYLDTAQRDCLREGIWEIVLPWQFEQPWERWSFGA